MVDCFQSDTYYGEGNVSKIIIHSFTFTSDFLTVGSKLNCIHILSYINCFNFLSYMYNLFCFSYL